MSIVPAWECQCSVEVGVPVSFAWAYMTDIRNWNDPTAEFALDGPFVEGARGTTRMPGRPLASATWLVWIVPDRSPTIQAILDNTHGITSLGEFGFKNPGPSCSERQTLSRTGNDAPCQGVGVDQNLDHSVTQRLGVRPRETPTAR
jgi:hypothetical protein